MRGKVSSKQIREYHLKIMAAKKHRLCSPRIKQPGLKTRTFDSGADYEKWLGKNKHRIKGDAKLGILKDPNKKILSITASYYLKEKQVGGE